MKHAKKIRKINIGILNIIFLASVLLFYEVHTDLFVREFAERELKTMLPKGTSVDIGEMEGGIFRGLVSKDVRISTRENTSGFNIEKIETSHRLWDSLLGKIPALSEFYNKKEIVLFIGKRDKNSVKGFFKLEGTKEALDIRGYLGVKKEDRIFINGTLKVDKISHFTFRQKKGTADLVLERKINGFIINSKINHLKLKGMDFVGECSTSVDTSESNLVKATVIFENVIIDYEPFNKTIEIFLSYNKAKDLLGITKFNVGDEIEGYGYTRLTPEHYVFLKWTIANLALEDYLKPKDIKEGVSGVMNGDFTLKGPLKEAALLAHFDVQNGNIGTMKFDSIIVNLNGKGPRISVYDSRICREDGYLTLDGEVDLSKLKGKEAFDNLIFDASKDSFLWEGWSVKREQENASMKAKKSLDKEFNISFEAHSEEDGSEEEHFLGVEHKVKF